MVLTLLFL